MVKADLEKVLAMFNFLETVLDRLTDQDDLPPSTDTQSLEDMVEIDGTTPHSAYCRDCDLCEGMDW
jgi:hypothetical protein